MKCPKCKEKMDLRSQGITDYKWYHDYFCDVCKIAKLQVKEDIRTWSGGPLDTTNLTRRE
tara:strand:+ start:8347 stop:8526 length:180 start_codon:yes stop_codon:yes gene_type:complete